MSSCPRFETGEPRAAVGKTSRGPERAHPDWPKRLEAARSVWDRSGRKHPTHFYSQRVIRPPAAEIPDAPGAYMFKDPLGRVVYAGKALSLRKRVGNYFARDLPERTRAMVEAAETVEWIVTDSEVAALMLEYSLIQRHRPRFNIRLRDDKSYPYLAITRTDTMAASPGYARRQEGRRGVLRPLRPRLCDPFDPGSVVAHVSDPDLHRCSLQAPAGSGKTLLALPHREMHRPLHRCRRARWSTRSWWMASPRSSAATPMPWSAN